MEGSFPHRHKIRPGIRTPALVLTSPLGVVIGRSTRERPPGGPTTAAPRGPAVVARQPGPNGAGGPGGGGPGHDGGAGREVRASREHHELEGRAPRRPREAPERCRGPRSPAGRSAPDGGTSSQPARARDTRSSLGPFQAQRGPWAASGRAGQLDELVRLCPGPVCPQRRRLSRSRRPLCARPRLDPPIARRRSSRPRGRALIPGELQARADGRWRRVLDPRCMTSPTLLNMTSSSLLSLEGAPLGTAPSTSRS